MLRILRKYTVSIVVVCLLAAAFTWWNSGRSFDDNAMAGVPEYDNVDQRSILDDESFYSKLEPTFLKYFKNKTMDGVKDTEGVALTVPGDKYTAISPTGAALQAGIGGEGGQALVLSEENSWVEYTVDIPEDGFYQMGMKYYAMEGKRASLLRTVQVDGKFPFMQSKKLEFMRMWREAGKVWTDSQGNEFNPRQEEVLGWQYADFRDSEGKAYESLRYHLTKGKHTIRISSIREPGAIGELRIFSPVHLPTYAEVTKTYEEKGYKESSGQAIKIQAEEAQLKSSPTLRRIENRDPASEPFNETGVGLNTFGGSSWRTGGQWAEWKFNVEQSGLYEIGMRNGSWFLDGIPVQRQVVIDGQIPFQEMNAVNFEYGGFWQLKKLSDADGNTYKYYLEKGEHTMRMEVQVGALGETFENVQSVSQRMSLLNREIILYTGTNPDPNRDWELDENIPNLIPRLHLMARDLDNAINNMYKLGVTKGSSQVSPLGIARDQLLNMAKDPDTIPSRLKQMTDTQTSLGTWINGLSQQALQLDYIEIKSPDVKWPKVNASWFSRTMTSAHDFFLSFTKDYRGVGDSSDGEKTLDVWVSYGRDWAAIIKQLADEDFTANTGIKVNINVIPTGDKNKLLLSTTAGLQPDVALGVDGQVPIDYAVRNALVDLNTFPDYKETAERFRPGALIPYQFNGGNYALPETQNFNMLFYRKDIMDQLGVTKIPDTWEEVMDLIPLLQQKGMDFYYPHAPLNPDLAVNEFSPFLYQNGGDYYKDKGTASNLDSPEAMQAFKMWTGLFTNYKINKDANFYNRFRTGEMPIGVADYSTYVLLSTAAPELTGWWGMKPMPGIKQEEDGQINRTTGGLAQTSVMFQKSGKKAEAWEFMKWWTSADVQEQFGTELEALLGVEARWNTANVEALKRLPWPTEDIQSILQQWDWFKEREIVLGGYYTTRMVANIWNEIVLNGKNQREAIEDGVISIDKEINKKREEFGLKAEASPGNEGSGGQ